MNDIPTESQLDVSTASFSKNTNVTNATPLSVFGKKLKQPYSRVQSTPGNDQPEQNQFSFSNGQDRSKNNSKWNVPGAVKSVAFALSEDAANPRTKSTSATREKPEAKGGRISEDQTKELYEKMKVSQKLKNAAKMENELKSIQTRINASPREQKIVVDAGRKFTRRALSNEDRTSKDEERKESPFRSPSIFLARNKHLKHVATQYADSSQRGSVSPRAQKVATTEIINGYNKDARIYSSYETAHHDKRLSPPVQRYVPEFNTELGRYSHSPRTSPIGTRRGQSPDSKSYKRPPTHIAQRIVRESDRREYDEEQELLRRKQEYDEKSFFRRFVQKSDSKKHFSRPTGYDIITSRKYEERSFQDSRRKEFNMPLNVWKAQLDRSSHGVVHGKASNDSRFSNTSKRHVAWK